jgi:flavin reductase (DIM6/NTAB) family NADH-FMN oxidoreductase RutF
MSTSIDPHDFRQVMGLFATGVTVVATMLEGEPHGMTANAITSVSLDPLLVLVCINNKLSMVEYIRQTQCFSISILREDQEPLSNYFAQLWKEPTPPPYRFAQWEGGLRLEGCLASLGCVLHGIYDGGDHRIVVARVMALYHGEQPYRPLLFYGGRYEKLPVALAEA